MRSIFAKILLWFSATLLVCLGGLAVTNGLRNRFGPDRHDFFSRSLSLQAQDAEYAYRSGGKPALREYFNLLEGVFPGSHALVDRNGIDLLTGHDWREQLARLGPQWTPGTQRRMMLAWPSRDGQYRYVIDTPAPAGPWSLTPYYLWIVLAAVFFSYILAVQLASPLRTLEQTVERFGHGELGVRAASKRKDEFGKLAGAFNLMAERIETLLTAERRLLQDVSHELRSPLARLEFAVELARTSADRNTAMDRIQKEVERLSALVSELLQVTRAESDPASRKLDPILLGELLEDLLDDSAMECQARRVRLRMNLTDGLELRGDRELLRRAVENVLRNAIRFAPAESAVEIGLRSDAEKAVIAIRDYGPGVSDKSLPDLFKPFFRAEADRNRNSGGVGLGLSIAERAVALHQGKIRASNAYPGLLVEIELPGVTARAQQLTAMP